MSAIKEAGTNNPVFLFDEVDKIGADFRGDPASALLEVLDPGTEQGVCRSLSGVPFDLSKVMFISYGQHHRYDPATFAGQNGSHSCARLLRKKRRLKMPNGICSRKK